MRLTWWEITEMSFLNWKGTVPIFIPSWSLWQFHWLMWKKPWGGTNFLCRTKSNRLAASLRTCRINRSPHYVSWWGWKLTKFADKCVILPIYVSMIQPYWSHLILNNVLCMFMIDQRSRWIFTVLAAQPLWSIGLLCNLWVHMVS